MQTRIPAKYERILARESRSARFPKNHEAFRASLDRIDSAISLMVYLRLISPEESDELYGRYMPL